ncbi:type II toxin-antitoxin system RelE/ParE family toxin [Azospirillum argentinense]|uniref:Type II toxin-antitoxin system RelE/ParE family toxin n=1 Tax=Azospirillum argentinense TaxID=2970906 RepID=A0A4D8P4Z6_9PROT|nr:type II toxin-antitoxin system RelE/ParE family toxin [Azospirillum argentinense]QCN94003.1 type II toxin-antitoxin system RelE/ParE family toxin [Azospirillum argentinense]
MRVVWRAAARADLVRILHYVSQENPVAARRLAQELVLAGDSLQVFPRRGRRGLVEGTRELVVVRPYVIVHDIGEDETVSILRLWHSAQDRG